MPQAAVQLLADTSIVAHNLRRCIEHIFICRLLFWRHFAAANVDGVWQTRMVLPTEMIISSFGEDAAGELYVMGHVNGDIYQNCQVAQLVCFAMALKSRVGTALIQIIPFVILTG